MTWCPAFPAALPLAFAFALGFVFGFAGLGLPLSFFAFLFFFFLFFLSFFSSCRATHRCRWSWTRLGQLQRHTRVLRDPRPLRWSPKGRGIAACPACSDMRKSRMFVLGKKMMLRCTRPPDSAAPGAAESPSKPSRRQSPLFRSWLS